MLNLNKIEAAGNLTRDIEVITPESGKAFSKGTIAVNDLKNRESVEYIDFVAFGEVGANLAKVTEKGNNVLIEGRLSVRPYEKDGKKRKSTEVIVESFQAVTRKAKAPAAQVEEVL